VVAEERRPGRSSIVLFGLVMNGGVISSFMTTHAMLTRLRAFYQKKKRVDS